MNLKLFQIAVLLFATTLSFAQKKPSVDQSITTHEIEAHLAFLAADEMRGRNAGSNELDIAANYIRAYFKINGLKPLPGAENYFQPVKLVKNYPVKRSQAMLADQSFTFRDNMLILEGDSLEWSGDLLYVGYGSRDELSKYDLKGKMVLALAGARDADNISKVLTASIEKRKAVMDAGGTGLVEILALPQAPWPGLVNYLGQMQWGIRKENTLTHVWLKPQDITSLGLKEGQPLAGKLSMGTRIRQDIPGKNVIGLIEGTDPKLKDEYIVVTAHYDHVGVQKSKDNPDSIFNGARDNAVGTVALLQTAKFLSTNPPKHSVILIALTSEEKGLLGSQWYTEHPLVSLNKTILSINCDGVGYNDKSILTSISWGRTSTDETVKKAAKAYGLGVGGDPDPREGFFERSDQVSFARQGVVAIKLQPGLKQMDDEIRKYYHQRADEVSSLDFDYLTKFYRAFVNAVFMLANETKRPSWNAGDKYEAVSKALYSEK